MNHPTGPVSDSERMRLLQQGIGLHQAGQLDQAEACYRQMLTMNPADADALRLIGLVHHGKGDARSAVDAFRRAVDLLDSPSNDLLCEYGHALLDARRAEEAATILRRATADGSAQARAWNMLGNALAATGDSGGAAEAFRRAVAMAPDFVLAWSNLATALQFLGRSDEAVEAYEKVLAAEPEFPCLYNYARLHRFEAGDPLLARMRERWAAGRFAGPEQAIDLGFGLAKALDDIGEYSEAFEVLSRANSEKRAHIRYSSDRVRDHFAAMRKRMTASWLDSVKLADDTGVRPIFIVGMPRSGSTLVEQILASHSSVTAAGELPFFPQALDRAGDAVIDGDDEAVGRVLGQVREDYLAAVRKRFGDVSCFTDKLPENFIHAALIVAAFPGARVVHVRRNPLDICLSCFQCNFTAVQPFAYDLDELADHYLEYDSLMAHWRTVLAPQTLCEIRYESLVERPEEQIRRLLDQCGLPWEESCLEFHQTSRPVTTASASQVRRPLYRSSMARWKRYAEQLAPLRARLQSVLDEE